MFSMVTDYTEHRAQHSTSTDDAQIYLDHFVLKFIIKNPKSISCNRDTVSFLSIKGTESVDKHSNYQIIDDEYDG